MKGAVSMQWIDEGIDSILEKFSYEFYTVAPDENTVCPCVNYTTKQGDPSCKICLGVGYKITIRKVEGAREGARSTFQNMSARESSVSYVYYIKSKFQIKEKDIIVDEDIVAEIHRMDNRLSADRRNVFNKCLAVSKKSNVQLFLKNFKEIIIKNRKSV